jgi:AAA domain
MSEPVDPIAERMVLAITLGAPMQAAPAFAALPADVWTDERHVLLAAVLADRYAREAPIERRSVMRECVDRAGTDAVARRMGQLVVDLGDSEMPASSIGYYVERVASLATARRIGRSAQQGAQRIFAATEVEDDGLFRRAVTDLRDACEEALVGFKSQPVEPPLSAADLLAGSDEYDWLVPGLLERTDRVIITGFEGHGKSFLTAMIAATIAAGIHPFGAEPLPRRFSGYRVLIVDCENSRRQLRRRFRRLLSQVDQVCAAHGMEPADWSTVLRFVIRPEGVSLTEPRELARMEQAVTATAPDLLVIGPMYRLSKIDVRDEQAAKELTDVIDLLRVRHQLSVLIETHAGHGQGGSGARQIRPLGSSLFLRWPEFGYGLRPHESAAHMEHPSLMEVSAWRGSRDERHWPRTLRHGQRLPWEPADPDYWKPVPVWSAA